MLKVSHKGKSRTLPIKLQTLRLTKLKRQKLKSQRTQKPTYKSTYKTVKLVGGNQDDAAKIDRAIELIISAEPLNGSNFKTDFNKMCMENNDIRFMFDDDKILCELAGVNQLNKVTELKNIIRTFESEKKDERISDADLSKYVDNISKHICQFETSTRNNPSTNDSDDKMINAILLRILNDLTNATKQIMDSYQNINTNTEIDTPFFLCINGFKNMLRVYYRLPGLANNNHNFSCKNATRFFKLIKLLNILLNNAKFKSKIAEYYETQKQQNTNHEDKLEEALEQTDYATDSASTHKNMNLLLKCKQLYIIYKLFEKIGKLVQTHDGTFLKSNNLNENSFSNTVSNHVNMTGGGTCLKTHKRLAKLYEYDFETFYYIKKRFSKRTVKDILIGIGCSFLYGAINSIVIAPYSKYLSMQYNTNKESCVIFNINVFLGEDEQLENPENIYSKILKYLHKINYNYDIIIVSDKSIDTTEKVLYDLWGWTWKYSLYDIYVIISDKSQYKYDKLTCEWVSHNQQSENSITVGSIFERKKNNEDYKFIYMVQNDCSTTNLSDCKSKITKFTKPQKSKTNQTYKINDLSETSTTNLTNSSNNNINQEERVLTQSTRFEDIRNFFSLVS